MLQITDEEITSVRFLQRVNVEKSKMYPHDFLLAHGKLTGYTKQKEPIPSG